MVLFNRETDLTTLFSTRQDTRTNLFFTPDAVGRVLDVTMTINGFDVTTSGLDYQYTETSRTNDTGAVLYFAQGTFSTQEELIAQGTAYPSLPGAITFPFTNPDPVPNPLVNESIPTKVAEITNVPFSACLATATTYSPLYTVTKSFNTGSTYTDGTLVYSFNQLLNRLTVSVKFDTTYGAGNNTRYQSVTTHTTSIFRNNNYLIRGASHLTYVNSGTGVDNEIAGSPLYEDRLNVTGGGGYGGNYVSFTREYELIASIPNNNTSDVIDTSSKVIEMVNAGTNVLIFNKPFIINDIAIKWLGIESFTSTETQAFIVKSYPDWTEPYTFKRTHGGGTDTYTITGGASTITYSELSPPFTPSNNDLFEIIQPVNGATLSLTYTKDFTIAYEGNAPTNWNVVITSVGINVPFTIQVRDPTTKADLDEIQMTTTSRTFDIRNLPLEAPHGGHPHIDWYGYGVVQLNGSGVTKTFDASYVNDPVTGLPLNGSEITAFDVTISQDQSLATVTSDSLIDSTNNNDVYWDQNTTGNPVLQSSIVANGVPSPSSTPTDALNPNHFIPLQQYTSKTLIPASQSTFYACAVDTTTHGVTSYSQIVSVDRTVHGLDTFLISFVDGSNRLDVNTNELSYDYLSIRTTLNEYWELLTGGILNIVTSNKLNYSSLSDDYGYTASYNNPNLTITNSSNPKAGFVIIGNITFEIFEDVNPSIDITDFKWTSLSDSNGVWYTGSIDVEDVKVNQNYLWSGLSGQGFNITTSGNIDIYPYKVGGWTTAQWSYQVDVGGTGTFGTRTYLPGTTTTTSGLGLQNGDVVRVFQPINGTNPADQTASGIVNVYPEQRYQIDIYISVAAQTLLDATSDTLAEAYEVDIIQLLSGINQLPIAVGAFNFTNTASNKLDDDTGTGRVRWGTSDASVGDIIIRATTDNRLTQPPEKLRIEWYKPDYAPGIKVEVSGFEAVAGTTPTPVITVIDETGNPSSQGTAGQKLTLEYDIRLP